MVGIPSQRVFQENLQNNFYIQMLTLIWNGLPKQLPNGAIYSLIDYYGDSCYSK